MKGALEGVRILDLTQMLAGPYGSMSMGDLGAEIIKLEPPGGDESRYTPPYFYEKDSAYFWSLNKSKKSIVVNLKNPEGLKIFYELVGQSDVVLENYRPGVTERLKIDYPTLKQCNPKIIHCSISAFGYDGPYRNRPGYDLIVQGMGGGMSITGEPGRAPVRSGIPIGDLMGGALAVQGILAAYIYRQKTGKGQWIDVSLLEGQLSLLTYVAQYFFHSGKVPGPIGSGHQTSIIYQAFKTKDIHIVVTALQDHHFKIFCQAIGKPEWAEDPRFATRPARLENRTTLIPMIEKILLTRSGDEWMEKFHEAGIPAGPINTLDRVFSDPHVLSRGIIKELEGPSGEKVKTVGNPLRMSETPPKEKRPPRVGEHTREVLSTILGYASDKIDCLAKAGVVQCGR